MAIICRDLRLLFIQAPRTGCTALENLLVSRFGGESLPMADIVRPDGFIRIGQKHCTMRQLLDEQLIPTDYQSSLTTLTTVRNPFDSLVSLYVKKREKYQPLLADKSSWVHKVPGYVEDMEFCRTHTLEEWLVKKYRVSPVDRLLGKGRRSLYGKYVEGVATVMRFERLQEDFERVMRSLGVTGDVTIPSVNATAQRQGSYRTYYTERARRLVEYVFASELDRYGYSFDGFGDVRSTPMVAEPVR